MAGRVIKDKINSKLNDRQKRFCIEYLKDLNVTRAYQTAYECEYEVANANGSRMLVNDSIKKYINDLLDEYKENIGVEVAEIVSELKKMALGEDVRNSDKIKALELLGKYKQMFVDKKEIDVNNNKIEITLE